jgi:hypothetical protein
MNNFDTSSTGENIELNVFYDTGLAQMYYDEFESENTRLNFGRDSAMFILGDVSAPYYKKSLLNKKKKSELWALWLNYDLGYDSDAYLYNKKDIIMELLNISIERHYKHLLANSTWHDIDEKIAHDYYISSGYSQGDSVYIVSIDKPIDKGLRRYIDNVLWASPISIYATINGEEYTEENFLGDDFYKYDVDAISENIDRLPISDYAKAWLIKALPSQPSY